jgi:alpha-1,2-mannosyltransferase
MLRRSGLPVMRVAVWWLCPLLPLVLTNAAHVDALLPPLLLGALLATLHGRGWLAGGLLGLAAGVKVWPLLLAPLVARWLPARARGGAAVAAAIAAAITLLPLVATLAAPDAGLSAYAGAWVVNNAPMSWALAVLGWEAGQVLRPLVAMAAGAVALVVAFRPPGAPDALVRAALIVSATTFYLSPAQYPWYAVWFLPFAVLLGCRALLLPAVLLPLYYLFFALLEEPGRRAFFAQGIAAVHVLGVLVMLTVSRLRGTVRT